MRHYDPLGLILFRRNCVTGVQIRALTQEFRAVVGRPDAPVMIDQEGGRVQRLRPPEWPDLPALERYGAWYKDDPDRAVDAVRRHGRILGLMLSVLGIDIDAAPVLDLRKAGASDVVGDRSFGSEPEMVATLGEAMIRGLWETGVVPVVKHIPGHGRATIDSHHGLPIVDDDLSDLIAADFRPFEAVARAARGGAHAGGGFWAMTAHVVFTSIDPDRPATLSPRVIETVIRERIGFQGVLVSDDLAMGAVSGRPADRVAACLAAGCDVALYCDPDPASREAAMAAARTVSRATLGRMKRNGAVALPEMQTRRHWRDEIGDFPWPPGSRSDRRTDEAVRDPTAGREP